MSKYSEALEMFKRDYNSCEEFVNENAGHFPAVKQALRIADRLERIVDGSDYPSMMMDGAGESEPYTEGCNVSGVFKRMAQELLKEEENKDLQFAQEGAE